MLSANVQTDKIKKRQRFIFQALVLSIFSLLSVVVPAYAQSTSVCCACKGPQDTDNNSCLTVATSKLADPNNCATLPSLSPSLKGWTCQTEPLGNPGNGKCRPVPQNGVCKGEPQDAFTSGELKSATQGTKNFVNDSGPAIIPKLNVQIPGFAFTGSAVTEDNSSLLAQYIAGAYRYLISISAVAATIMFTFGAFLYLLGGAMPSINSGKRIMQDAVIGMFLVLGATLILRTINPATTTLSALYIKGVQAEAYSSSLIGNQYAPDVLTGLGLAPGSVSAKIPTYGIPADCPGRDRSSGGANAYYAINYKGRTLTQDVINKYLQEQQRTGIPAAVIMAQMFSESGGSCPVINLFDNPAQCGGAYAANYNFGGIGCTQRQVPSDACAHLAFPTAAVGAPPSSGAPSFPMTVADVNKYWNDAISPNCSALLNAGATRDTYVNCGPKCYPQKSHTTVQINGQEIWIQSVQCSRKFANPQEFLDSHLQAIRACLPYNDSVYKFAYCIGASTYASTGKKAKVLADVIERNCLCDPSKDSTGCKRDKKLESDIENAIVQKTNLFKQYSAGKLDQAAYDRVAQALWQATGGRLTPGPGEAIREEEVASNQDGAPPPTF